ncbi:VOC family protein [Parafrigoribacterium mesophilum]|uniref:VOC family protein n=1 Tax=Parafrigoribacterium mesophilum TaxID=433646 RepID=UPI0031FBD58B
MSSDLLTPTDTAEPLAGSSFVHLDGTLYATFTTGDFASASELVAQVARAADVMNHHPEISLGWGKVSFQLSSHDAGGVTSRDVKLAAEIQKLADTLGAKGREVQPTRYEMAIDCVDADGIRDFWRVALGYEERDDGGETQLVDPRGIGPTIWFQHMDPPRTDRNRIHLDVYVPTEDAQSRVDDVIQAGGDLMTAEHAPDWWVLADVEGNELCICTSER